MKVLLSLFNNRAELLEKEFKISGTNYTVLKTEKAFSRVEIDVTCASDVLAVLHAGVNIGINESLNDKTFDDDTN